MTVQWGEVEHVNLIARLSISFVRFRYRAVAEFAREAMANQELDAEEILHVKWAYDDPNPVAQDAANRADADAVVNMMRANGVLNHTAECCLLIRLPPTFFHRKSDA